MHQNCDSRVCQARAFLQYWTHLVTSATAVEPCGTGYSSSMSAGNVHLFLTQQLEHFLEGRLALAPGDVAAGFGPALQVQADKVVRCNSMSNKTLSHTLHPRMHLLRHCKAAKFIIRSGRDSLRASAPLWERLRNPAVPIFDAPYRV